MPTLTLRPIQLARPERAIKPSSDYGEPVSSPPYAPNTWLNGWNPGNSLPTWAGLRATPPSTADSDRSSHAHGACFGALPVLDTDEDLELMRDYPYFADVVLESSSSPGPVEIDGVVCTWRCMICPELVEFTLAADSRPLGWLRPRFRNLTVQPQEPETSDWMWDVMLLQQKYGENEYCSNFATYDDCDFHVQEAVALLR